jgi:hypothetical protein
MLISEDHHNNHELTTQEVPIEVVALVGNFTALVSDGYPEKLFIDGARPTNDPWLPQP